MTGGGKGERDVLAESLNDLFTNVSTVIKGDLQFTDNMVELLEKMNITVCNLRGHCFRAEGFRGAAETEIRRL
uniref:Uncharacterized protein n=1 Tax=Kalanchoe fedtschenkoi TaxID=63787 RepID=A0A7N1A1C5_KALFE